MLLTLALMGTLAAAFYCGVATARDIAARRYSMAAWGGAATLAILAGGAFAIFALMMFEGLAAF